MLSSGLDFSPSLALSSFPVSSWQLKIYSRPIEMQIISFQQFHRINSDWIVLRHVPICESVAEAWRME